MLKLIQKSIKQFTSGFLAVSLFTTIFTSLPAAAATTKATQVSTGSFSTCAIVGGDVKCWGLNNSGQIGNGITGGTQATPVNVATNTSVIPADPGVCSHSGWFGCDSYSRNPAPAVPASAMGDRDVTKVSVGYNHACALADARVFCWGNNSVGQLGNRSTNDSSVPIAVDSLAKDYTPPPAMQTSGCGGWFQPACRVVAQPTVSKSALGNKEVIDIAAGYNFTCALASDGSIACWGEGAYGRLGTNSSANTTYPSAVYSGSDSGLSGKKAVKLARASAFSMCALVVDNAVFPLPTNNSAVCWGQGMGSGAVPATSSTTSHSTSSSCSASSSTSYSGVTYFDTAKPVAFANIRNFADVDVTTYATALGTNNKAYYWGANGYTTYVTTRKSCGNGSGSGGLAANGTHCGGGSNHGSPGCAPHVPITTTTTYTHGATGYGTVSGPLYNDSSTPLGLKPIRLISGDGVGGLFCATTGVDSYCDTHGGGGLEGETGSNFVPYCVTTGFIFTTTTCNPPVGPQKVVTSGWLAGKSVSQLDTGGNFSCAVANGSVGCWGLNTYGQLGEGDGINRGAPTEARL